MAESPAPRADHASPSLACGATGLEAPAVLGREGGELLLLITAVDAKRSPLSWHEVRFNLGDVSVQVGTEVDMARPASGAWNDRFPLPVAAAGSSNGQCRRVPVPGKIGQLAAALSQTVITKSNSSLR